jgi:small-conductance mechanosensitive channel
MDWFSNWISELVGISSDTVKKVAGTALVLVSYFLLRKLIARVMSAGVEDPISRFRIGRVTRILLILVGGMILTRIWIRGTEGIGTWLGLLSAGIAVALQEPLENLAGWIYIVASRPFRVGDRIQIGSYAGDIVDIRPLSFALLEIGNWVEADQSTGRVLQIPNGWLFKEAVAGYDHGFPFIWNEITITVTFESDWRLAKSTLESVLKEHAEQVEESEFEKSSEFLGIQYSRLTPVVWVDSSDSGVRLTMRYLCRPRSRRVSTSKMWEAILDAFNALPKVDFAYPTTRRFDHAREGKLDLRAPYVPEQDRT